MTTPKIFYRYDGYEFIHVDEYHLVKETPCGYWISNAYLYKPKFIHKNARKSFAYPTKELALKSFVIRKQWQIGHLKRQLSNARAALYQARKGIVDDNAVNSSWLDENEEIWGGNKNEKSILG